MSRPVDERDTGPFTNGRTRRGILAGFLGNGLALVALREMDARKKKKKKKHKKGKKKKAPTQNPPCGAGCPSRMSCVSGACALRVCAACSYNTLQAAVDAALPGDTIVMDAGTYTDPTRIDKSLTIVGSGHSYPSPVVGPATIVKVNQRTALYVADDITVKLSNLLVTECHTPGNGGAMAISGVNTEVEIANSWLHGNRADFNGGSIYNTGKLRLVSSKISSSRAKQLGGGIFNASSGRLALINSEIVGNSAGGASGFAEAGGGIFNRETNSERGVVSNESSTVSQNSPDQCAYTSAC